MTTIALAVHNILEGMVVFTLSAESLPSGAAYALGVALHNLPFGMLIFSSLSHEKRGVKVAAIALALLSTAAGGLIMMAGLAGPEIIRELMECAALGMVAYIVLAELAPDVSHELGRPSTLLAVIAGFALVALASLLA